MRPQSSGPVLFLDYDGCLQADAVYRIKGQIVMMSEGRSLFEWAPVLQQLIEPYPQLQVVLSTTWVRVLGFDVAKAWLPEALQRQVIGATWHNSLRAEQFQYWTRHDQILNYVRRHNLQRWLALDDNAKGWAQKHIQHLVHTDSVLGLSDVAKQLEMAEKLALLVGEGPKMGERK